MTTGLWILLRCEHEHTGQSTSVPYSCLCNILYERCRSSKRLCCAISKRWIISHLAIIIADMWFVFWLQHHTCVSCRFKYFSLWFCFHRNAYPHTSFTKMSWNYLRFSSAKHSWQIRSINMNYHSGEREREREQGVLELIIINQFCVSEKHNSTEIIIIR